MLTLRLSALDVARLRFAFSPLWECVAAFRVWRARPSPALHRPWVEAIDRAVRDRDWSMLDSVAMAPSGILPDFIAPPPLRPFATFDDEIATLLRTPALVVHAELVRAQSAAAAGLRRRDGRWRNALLTRIAADLRFFWHHAVAPIWPRVSARLAAEVAYRSRVLALDGGAAVLRSLHATVRFSGDDRGGALRIVGADDHRRAARGRGLLLVPSVFAFPHVYVVTREPWRPTVAYPARGLETVWRLTTRTGDVRMAAMLGDTRARLLRRLVLPHTTLELAAAIGLNASTVSEHLASLSVADVVRRTRVGRQVFYSLSERGLALSEAFR